MDKGHVDFAVNRATDLPELKEDGYAGAQQTGGQGYGGMRNTGGYQQRGQSYGGGYGGYGN